MNCATTIVLCNCWMLEGRAAALHRRLARHIRWYADGEAEYLTEAEKEAARARILADNQAVEKLLEEKGFVMTDQAHPSTQVSRYFQIRPDADDDRR